MPSIISNMSGVGHEVSYGTTSMIKVGFLSYYIILSERMIFVV